MRLAQSDPALRKKVGPEGFLEGEEEQDEGDLDSGGEGGLVLLFVDKRCNDQRLSRCGNCIALHEKN
jgi:hypothetical protein